LAAVSLGGRGGALGSSLVGDLGSDLLGLRSTSELFVGILKSRTVQDHLIAQFDLKHVYWVRRIEDARKELEDHTDVSVDRKSQIVIVKVTDKDRYRAAAMARLYIDELNRAVTEVSTSSARQERIFLERRLKEVKEDLESSEKDFSQYASKNTAIDVKEQGKAMVEAAATLQGQLIAAQSRLQEMRQIYTSNNVRVRGLQARVAELQNQMDRVGGKGEDLSAPSGQKSDSLYPSIRKLPLLGVEWADLYRRVRVQEVVFETLTQQYELARVEEAKEVPTVKVLDTADVPEKQSWPPRMLIIASGTLLSILVAIGWVVGTAKWQQIDPQDPGKALAEEVVATVKSNRFLVRQDGSQLRP
jgi:capsule polysaccharide export protein KpsE/RkpR